jgi:hypothetical protein
MDNESQRIEQWGVVGQDRLAGIVYNRPGHRDGGMIVTSPVLEIRVMGDAWPAAYAVAFTESGNAYRLGRPSESFGVEEAERFITGKLIADTVPMGLPRERKPAPDADRTIVRAALDTTLQKFERIEVYETSFKPL